MYSFAIRTRFKPFIFSLTPIQLPNHFKSPRPQYWTKCVDRYGQLSGHGVGKKVNYLLSTGNVKSSTGLDLMQASGFTIVADKINFLRYLSHFRSVHRGQFFTTMKSTAVRKLLPDQWGFLCPVNTPDGSPCGLLSHLTRNCSGDYSV
jgi:DNA-directed RNA polymerase I subunit RPA2